jgi:hypothetical protein
MSRNAGDRGRSRISRRAFVGGAGLGAGAVAAKGAGSLLGTGTESPPTSETPVVARGADQNPLNFGRMFPDLPPFAENADDLQAALREVGRPGGIMDANDDLAAGPVALIVDESLNQVNRNNPAHTAGTTFVGQFLDHDITFDSTSQLGVPTEPQTTRNTRVASLDLDSVFGGGPNVSPQLYQSEDRAKLRIESGGMFEDLPRNADGSAIIADPRNDENMVISGLQAAFIIFHNTMVDRVRADGLVPDTSDVNAVFTFARNETRWHYQRMIMTQFLPQVVGQALVNNIIRQGRRFYRPRTLQAYMPVEFRTGAYRMGHSMVRPSYRANFTGQPADKPNTREFFGFIFDPGQEGPRTPRTCGEALGPRGGSSAGRRSSTSATAPSGPTRSSTR